MSFDYQKICAALFREARLLDDRTWDEWLACYTEDVTYWMPAWDDDDRLTDDHESQISLMYYPDRGGLEDRVFLGPAEVRVATGGEIRRAVL